MEDDGPWAHGPWAHVPYPMGSLYGPYALGPWALYVGPILVSSGTELELGAL